MQKRIAYFVKEYRGCKTYLYDEIRSLRTFEPIILTEMVGNLSFCPDKLKVFLKSDIPQWKLRWREKEKFFRDILVENKVKLIRAVMGYGGMRMLPLCEKLNLPLVTSFHGVDISERPRRRRYRKKLKELFKKGNIFLVRSKAMKEDSINLGCEPEKIIVHYGGIDIDKFRLKKRREKSNGQIRILMCGRFVEKKGFEYGIRAFAKLLKRHKNIEMRIIGDGYLRWKLKLLVKMLGIQKKVIFLGMKEPKYIPQEMSNADIFIAPSITSKIGDKEGIPNTIKEAMATGLPVVSTLHAGIPELMIEGETGFLVPERDVDGLAEKLDYLITHPEIWEKLGRRGREVVMERFNLVQQVKELEQIYRDVTDKRGK